MRMTDSNTSSVNVSALRDQLQEKINGYSCSSEKQTSIKHACSTPSSPVLQRPSLPNFSHLPPIPPHRNFQTTISQERSLEPPPFPPHLKISYGNNNPRKINMSKPPVAPKPKSVVDEKKNSNPLSTCLPTPAITVSSSDITDFVSQFVWNNPEDNISDAVEDQRRRPSNSESVRELARQFEESGLPFAALNTSSASSGRPVSTISTLSLASTENDEVAMSDSETDDERPSELRRDPGLDLLSPNKATVRRPSVGCFSGDPFMHEKIMDELKRQGVIRSSNHLFKHGVHVLEHSQEVDTVSISSTQHIPSDIGKLRDDKKVRTIGNLSIHIEEGSSSASTSRVESIASDRSSMLTSTDYETVIDYQTGDSEEDRRLKKLHYAANEFFSVQKNFLKYLKDMGEVYPQYIYEFGKRLGKDLLNSQGTQQHVVRQLQHQIEQLIPVHQLLLDNFAAHLENWSSQSPDMADVIIKYADFLKICKPFLLEKTRFVQELTRLREENKDFDNATVAFEQKIFHRGVGAVVQQLDQVHQNFMRYKILMLSYDNYLKENSEERWKTREAISKLESIAQSVNEAMGLPSNEELFRLYDRFQCQFDVFYPGRRLIRQGEVLKQTRKEPQPRYLVLFSDTLWICRVASGFGSSELFDMNRSYRIPIETVRTEYNPHEDYEKQLLIKSKAKSLILILSSVRERQQWEREINIARDEKRKYKRRMSEAIERQRRQSLTPLVVQTTIREKVMSSTECHCNNDKCQCAQLKLIDSLSMNCDRSRCNSETNSLETVSQPGTPVDELPASSINSGIIKKKILLADTMKPLWIPDDSSTKCLMDGCDTVFSFLNRRHHCRDCGWLICSSCMGRAPLAKFDFKKEIVCPECYEKIESQYRAGTLFPTHLLARNSDGIIRVRIGKTGKRNEKKFSIVEPQTLFLSPINRSLKRSNVRKRIALEDGLVFGKVFVKTPKGTELIRHAQLTDGMVLKFYKAAFDDDPCNQYVIYGFELREIELEQGGTQFELVHRNQIQTDRKEHLIIFRVEHEKSVKKWSTALRQGLNIT